MTRNPERCKQRLVRKVGKLSAHGLERIATLKRCGLYVVEPAEDDASVSTADVSPSASSSSSQVTPAPRLNEKLMIVRR